MRLYLLASVFSVITSLNLFAQDTASPVKISSSFRRLNDKEVLLVIKAQVKGNAKLYSVKKVSNDAPYSEITFDSSFKKLLSGEVAESGQIKKGKEPLLENMEVAWFTDSATWEQKINLAAKDSAVVEGTVNCFVQEGDSFNPKEEHFTVIIPTAAVAAEQQTATMSGGSIWSIFLAGLGAGLLALIFPCIYAMIPVTVSFFLKRSKTKQEGVKNAVSYSLSIVIIFAIIGFIFGLTRNAGFANDFASSAVFNIFVFLLFLVFGISFLGAFEITLPSSWTNKIDSKANTQSFVGIFFMALTLVVVSFSCTAPFISYFAVTPGLSLAERTIAFGGFGLGIALPFTLFALSPSLLNKLAKGGGWLNSLKVCFGFIELALAMKFLSSADLAYHWRLLDREVYLALWIVIFGLLGLYLLGKLKLSHDDELPKNDYGHPYLTVTRLFFAIAALSFTIYMVPGLFGAPLKGISAWLPEIKTQDFNLNRTTPAVTVTGVETGSSVSKPKKYTDFLESEIRGVECYFDYEEALAAAKQAKKPLMIDFTGHSCANCRKMEQEVLNDPSVTSILNKDFIVVSLYVDDKYALPQGEWKKSAADSTVMLKRMGDKNLDFEVALTKNNAQPLYVFVDNDGKIIQNAGGYNPDIQRFVGILQDVKQRFK